ncbi:uncharacterized protein LOC131256413 [Magnolia sinica]|uniref:uncharacterized protein LOC131256413 n=1 Tax=Magnolia sinica TaxID=86752 RepID=UPI00265A6E3F|nr:uncharacterized protein LOC131256413 [Magnolia sinica]
MMALWKFSERTWAFRLPNFQYKGSQAIAPNKCLVFLPLTQFFHCDSQPLITKEKMIGHQLDKLVGTLKSKLRVFKMKKPYNKIDKSDSMRMEIRSRKARKIIEETLKIADSPGHKSYAF